MTDVYLIADGSAHVDDVLQTLSRMGRSATLLVNDFDSLVNFDFHGHDLAGHELFIASGSRYLGTNRTKLVKEARMRRLALINIIDPSVELPGDVELGANVYIGRGATLKSGVSLADGAVIQEGATLGTLARIGNSTWIGRDVRIASRTVIGRNTLIGDHTEVRCKEIGSYCELDHGNCLVESLPASTHLLRNHPEKIVVFNP